MAPPPTEVTSGIRAHDIAVRSLGLVPYGEALALQQRLHDEVARGVTPSTVLFLEHPPVITMGKNDGPESVLVDAALLAARGVEIFATERGGKTTAHMPGQLVVYPIVDIQRLRLTARGLVRVLERYVIETLAAFDLRGVIDESHPGVWIGREKVCALGLRIKRHVSMHGLALNVCNDMDVFGMIVPCGITDRGVTSMSLCLGRRVAVSEVGPRLATVLTQLLENPRDSLGS